MKGGLASMIQQAQKMQQGIEKMQAELAKLEETGRAGGDLVTVTMTGQREVRGIRIDDSLLGEDRDMLEDLLIAAFNDAVHRVERVAKEKYAGLAGGLNLSANFESSL